jgi:hypothetical protein
MTCTEGMPLRWKWRLKLVLVLKAPHSHALTRSCVAVPLTIGLYRLGILQT